MFTVFSRAHFGPIAAELKTAAAVVRFVGALQARGDRDILVGTSLEHAVPYAIWLQAQPPASLRPSEGLSTKESPG